MIQVIDGTGNNCSPIGARNALLLGAAAALGRSGAVFPAVVAARGGRFFKCFYTFDPFRVFSYVVNLFDFHQVRSSEIK